MPATAARPALVIFTLGPEAESARRGLLPPPWRRTEEDLHRACFEAALAAGEEAGCRIEVCSPAPLTAASGAGWQPQERGDFGTRLVAAFDQHAADGTPTVVVGTDTPGLEASHVRRALALLAAAPGRAVLGPSPDGGFYLLAADRPLGILLDGVPWCHHDTLEQLRRALQRAGIEVVLLEPLADLDHPTDLERWLAASRTVLASRWHRLVGRLRQLLADRCRPLLPRMVGQPTPALVPVRRGRAPPRRP